MLGGDLGVKVGVFKPGGSIELAADPFDGLADLPGRRPLLRALENHVFEEVGDAGQMVRLVPAADGYEEPDSHREGPGLLGGNYPQAIFELNPGELPVLHVQGIIT